MDDFSFTSKVGSMNLEYERDYCQVILKDVSFTLHEGSLDEIYKGILFEKHYIVTFKEIKKI